MSSREGCVNQNTGWAASRAPLWIVAISFLIQLGFIWSASLERLVTYAIVDDAFYYLQIARNVMHGFGTTFDGFHKTNGFQPLWQILLLPIGLVPSKTIALRVTCTLGAILFQLAGVILYDYAKQLFNRAVSLWALALWCLNARLLLTYSLDGMEFSLFALTVVTFFRWDLQLRRMIKPAVTGGWLLLGVLWGLCALVRLDGMLLGLLAAAAIAWRWRDWPDWPKAFAAVSYMVLGLCVTAIPYFAWNALQFGHLMPVSGAIKQHEALATLQSVGVHPFGLRHFALATRDGGYYFLKYFMRFITGYFYYLARFARIPQSAAGLLGLVAFGSAVLAAVLRGRWVQPCLAARALSLLWVFVAAHFLVYAVLLLPFINYGNWYFGPLYLAFCLACALVAEPIHVRAQAVVNVGMGILFGANIILFFAAHDEPKINIFGAMDCLKFTEARLQGETIGSWNAGYLGYFSERNTFTNLDGLVGDYELAQCHLKDRPVQDYLKRKSIRFLCDYQMNPAEIERGFYGLDPSQYEVMYRSNFYQPAYVDPRIYYVIRIKSLE